MVLAVWAVLTEDWRLCKQEGDLAEQGNLQ